MRGLRAETGDGASNRGMAGPPSSCKGQGTESPPELLEGVFPTPPSPATLNLDFRPLEV